jgi:hypothetical protein
LTSILFITSNGIGMGHLTRVMAIARKLPGGLKPIILTMSKGLPTARRQGFYTEYFPSKNVSNLDDRAWRIGFETRVLELIEEHQPAVVAFDGIYPYMGLRNALQAHPEAGSVWIRRAMWSPGRGAEQLQYSDLFDVILEPGEFAAERDEGLTVPLRDQAFSVAPIIYCDESELLSREAAEAELGLEPCRTRALIQIGEVPVQQRDFIMQTSASHILQHPEVQVAILESAISEHLALPPAVIKLAAVYPIARLYRAFDFVISAAGYNSYHELISFQIPAGFLPVLKPTDDQAVRARYAEEQGVGIEVGLDTTRAIEILLNEPERTRMSSRARELSFANGAQEAAEEISRLASTSERTRRRRRAERAGARSRAATDGRTSLRNGTAEASGSMNVPAKIQHLVLTRYAQKGLWYDDFSADWLEDRLNVFSRYCVPSMAQQTASDFSWLVFCDETLDRDRLDAIEERAAAVPQFKLVLTSHEKGVRLPNAIRPLIDEDTDVLITTRLDNDDGLHKETIAVLQSYLPAFVNSPHPRWVVNFPRGYRYDAETGRAFAAVWLHGAFMSMFEKMRPGKREFRNIYKVRHNWLHHTMPLHFDESIPAWLQVIHGLAESTDYRSGVPLTGGNNQSLIRRDIDIEIDPAEIEADFGIEAGGGSGQASEAGAAPQA